MRLIIVRHGETVQNVQGVCQGQSEGYLTENGINQAKKLGIRLKDKKIDAVYSSDLIRTVDTAKHIIEYHPELDLKLDKRLRERNFGSFEGKVRPELDWSNLPDDVETDMSMYNRAKDFVDEIYETHKNQTVLVVSHGGLKRAFYTLFHNLPISEYGSWDSVRNTSVSEFEISEDGNHKIHLLNCIEHLKN